VAVFRSSRGGPTSLFFDQHLGFEEEAHIVGALVRHAHFNGLDALVACRRVEVKAVAAGMQIRATVPAFVGNLDLLLELDLSRAVVAARDKVETGFYPSSCALRAWRRLGFLLAVTVVHVTALTILSAHGSPQMDLLWNTKRMADDL